MINLEGIFGRRALAAALTATSIFLKNLISYFLPSISLIEWK